MLHENSIVYYDGQLYTVAGFTDDLRLMIMDNHYIVKLSPKEFFESCTIIGEL